MKGLRWSLSYAWLTIKHKWYILLAGYKVGGISWLRLVFHDFSKFSLKELPYYGRQFIGDGNDPDGFDCAWIHHQNHNDHHWEYWIPRTCHNRSLRTANDPIPMPEGCVREMVADWLAASKTYTGSWDMADWVHKNLPKIRLHPKTRGLVEETVAKLVGEQHDDAS